MQANTYTYYKTSSIPQVTKIAFDYLTATESDILNKKDILSSIEEFVLPRSVEQPHPLDVCPYHPSCVGNNPSNLSVII